MAYIPGNATLIQDTESDAYAWIYPVTLTTGCQKLAMQVFYGKRETPCLAGYYADEADRDAAMRRCFVERREARLAARFASRASRRA